MPRARNIKHSFFVSEKVADNDPLGRLLFIGMWTLADYKGDLVWKPRSIKVQILPFDDCDIEQLAINLDKSGLIRFYSNGDSVFVHIVGFGEHQNPHINEKKKGSEIPGYSDNARQAIDLERLAIYPDKSGQVSFENGSNPADSRSLIPDSESLIPENKESPNVDSSSCSHCDEQEEKPEKAQDLFNDLWQAWPRGYGEKGSKKKALEVFRKLKPDRALTNLMIQALNDQTKDKANKTARGEFAPNFQHVERWIKNRRWEDDIDPISVTNTQRGPVSRAERDRQSADEFYQRLDQQIAAAEASENAGVLLGDPEGSPPGDGAGGQ